MIQRFIELGTGYSDIYELIEIGRSNQNRILRLLALHTEMEGKQVISPVIVLQPAQPGNFQPLYICREGIPSPRLKPNKRYGLFEELAKELGKSIIELEVKPSNLYSEKELYFQHLIGILRMNKYLPPMS
ncbi:methylthioribose kinase [Actinomycetes bacterium NPDC127524]|uniref:DUF7147 family protein n=1 Tax=Bacillus sp. OV322 TaxID=1882764 RepID=UPI0008E835A7|nr:methylthioribose kinase [Bacillus sp. OV322]SFC04767.1 hypothetical protein SAMN05443252_101618 [Bacillus sp. OV322]